MCPPAPPVYVTWGPEQQWRWLCMGRGVVRFGFPIQDSEDSHALQPAAKAERLRKL
jgi:hypothetical protein